MGATKRVSSVQPAIRSVRMEEGHEAGRRENSDAGGQGETLAMGGLSSNQQQWLMQAAEQMRAGGVRRPDFLPVFFGWVPFCQRLRCSSKLKFG